MLGKGVLLLFWWFEFNLDIKFRGFKNFYVKIEKKIEKIFFDLKMIK